MNSIKERDNKFREKFYYFLAISLMFLICIPAFFRDYAFHNDAVVLGGFLDKSLYHLEFPHLIIIGRPLEAFLLQFLAFFPVKSIDYYWILRIRNFLILSLGLYFIYKSCKASGIKNFESSVLITIVFGSGYFLIPILWIGHMTNAIAFLLSTYVLYLEVNSLNSTTQNNLNSLRKNLIKEFFILISIVWIYPPYVLIVLSANLFALIRKNTPLKKLKIIFKRTFNLVLFSLISATSIGFLVGRVIFPMIIKDSEIYMMRGYGLDSSINLFSFNGLSYLLDFWSDMKKVTIKWEKQEDNNWMS